MDRGQSLPLPGDSAASLRPLKAEGMVSVGKVLLAHPEW